MDPVLWFRGGCVPSVRIGDIVVADSIVDTHGQSLIIDVAFPGDPARGLHIGRVLTSDAVVRLVAEKQQFAQQYGALAVDMESLAVAQVCREQSVRRLSVRAISDDLSGDLPPEVSDALRIDGNDASRGRFGGDF